MPAVTKEETSGLGSIQFFPEVDYTYSSRGVRRCASEYPCWFSENLVESLKEDIDEMTSRLSTMPYDPGAMGALKNEIVRKKERLAQIVDSMPKLSPVERDKLGKAYAELGKKIGASLFSRDDMRRGWVDPAEEARRMVEYLIDLSPDVNESGDLSALAMAMNVRLKDKRLATRNEAVKMFRIMAKLLDADGNIERLRKD